MTTSGSGIDPVRHEVIRAALSYVASEMADETHAHYGNELELKSEMLDEAIGKYVDVRADEMLDALEPQRERAVAQRKGRESNQR